ncbi:MAG TPA: hypothetical protein VJT74_16890, partial [Pyrinomonadaceae bacterium]|nr:hypothetical protein [Pyrinomonadaceae bacterium]
TTKVIETNVGYNNSGSVILSRDALGRQTDIEYTDSFSDTTKNSLNTLAFPTKITPPLAAGETAASFATTAQYNYDFGAVTRTQGPVPALQSAGPVQTMEFDTAGRLTKINSLVNNSYRRWVYSTSGSVTTYWKNDSGATESLATTVFDGAGRERATSTTHPGSTGGYSGEYTYYDVMGRVQQVSNQTEMNATWSPVGDDDPANANGTGYGWVWTQQTYDWKGRPRVTTNPDGTFKDITYSGCGCAGGEVVTVKDEMSRRRRDTADVLGRPWKTEILNPNLSVYTNTTNLYNALDGVTQITQQVGSSGTTQSTTIEYDGFGRTWKTKTPEATAPTVTTYLADGSVDTVTDARSAVIDYSYTVRGQISGITYSAPTPIIVPGSVAYGYDPAGNRLWMTDDLGRVDYTYDALSHLTQESRDFTGVNNPTTANGNYNLSYTYTWTGAVKSVTDPFGKAFNYAFDQVGRVTGISGTAFAGITQYASLIKYRAWGAAKSITYGDGYKADLLYNKRLDVSQYDLKDSTSTRMMGADYTYYNDGRLKFVDDLREPRFDRLYDYDHVGRVIKAETGYLARGEAYPGDNSKNGPYNHYYGYDEFNHLTSRTGSYWYKPGGETYTATYINNKNQNAGWTYDADGRVTQSQTTGSTTCPPCFQTYTDTYTYDAAGRRSDSGLYDGDGQVVKRGSNYIVRSTALHGLSITEVYNELQSSTLVGTKVATYIYLGGEAIATQYPSTVNGTLVEKLKWRRTDPENTSTHDHDEYSLPSSYGGKVQMALDLQGIATEVPDYTKLQQDPAYYNQTYNSYNYGAYGTGGGGYPPGYSTGGGVPGNFGTGCTVDGMSMPCDFALQLQRVGVADRCPNNYCGPQVVDGRVVTLGYNPDTGELGYGHWERVDIVFKDENGDVIESQKGKPHYIQDATAQTDSLFDEEFLDHPQKRPQQDPSSNNPLKLPNVGEDLFRKSQQDRKAAYAAKAQRTHRLIAFRDCMDRATYAPTGNDEVYDNILPSGDAVGEAAFQGGGLGLTVGVAVGTKLGPVPGFLAGAGTAISVTGANLLWGIGYRTSKNVFKFIRKYNRDVNTKKERRFACISKFRDVVDIHGFPYKED